jgi:hypothetical protein
MRLAIWPNDKKSLRRLRYDNRATTDSAPVLASCRCQDLVLPQSDLSILFSMYEFISIFSLFVISSFVTAQNNRTIFPNSYLQQTIIMAFSATQPTASPFNFPKKPGIFGDLSSVPKSPKVSAIENPYLKNPPMGGSSSGAISAFGGGNSSSRTFDVANSYTTSQFHATTATRVPLVPLRGGEGVVNFTAASSLSKQLTKPNVPVGAPRPPPNMSLSLMEGVVVVPTQPVRRDG